MKTVLFIPGMGEGINDRDYASVIKTIESKGYKVTFLPIQWRRTTITDWTNELNSIYTQYDPKQTILAGFSCGAMAALAVAAQSNPAELWLFSLSPYFAEDIKSKLMNPAWIKAIGKRRTAAFAKLGFRDLASKVFCKTLVLAGEQELSKWPIMKRRLQNAIKTFPDSKLTIVPKSEHDVANENYIQVIKNSI